MSDHTEPATRVEQVPEPKLEPTAAMQAQLTNLEAAVLALTEADEQASASRQELQKAGDMMGQAVQAFRSQMTTITQLVKRMELVERKTQGLADRPMIRSCECGKQLDALASHCPACGKPYRG